MIERSAKLGFDGASCIHPAQVPILNECFGPSAEAVAYAERVIEADKEARAEGRGSFQLDGNMIDIPLVVRAERLLARHRAIEARIAKAEAVLS